MPFKSKHGVITIHALAIVGNFQQAPPAGFYIDDDACRAGIDRVFDQFFSNRSGPLDDFTGGDQV